MVVLIFEVIQLYLVEVRQEILEVAGQQLRGYYESKSVIF